MADNHQVLSNALQSLLSRLDEIEAQCQNSFPLYSIGTSNDWLKSSGGSWVGGFWSGCWWLRSQITKSPADFAQAQQISERLSPKVTVDSINRAMIFWYGLSLNNQATDVLLAAENAVAVSYNPQLACIPVGTEMGGGKEGHGHISIDSLAAVLELLNVTRQVEHQQIAKQHLDTLLAALGTAEGAFHAHACFYDNKGFVTNDKAGNWSRGQAWAMLGLSKAAIEWGEPYVTQARKACSYWISSRSEPFPPHHLDNPTDICDPSATVIACIAMLSLSELSPDNKLFSDYAQQQLCAIINSEYFTESGIFWGCCYKTNQGQNELVETAWGSFFLLLALITVLSENSVYSFNCNYSPSCVPT